MIKTERFKNPYFWVGLGAVVLTAMGVDASTFTTWDSVGSAVMDLVTNPFMLGTTALAVLGVFVDPTTKGVTDEEAYNED